jgi:glycogen debranching enzyme
MSSPNLAVIVGSGTMLRADADGSVLPADAGAPGLFLGDTRLLGEWRLSVDGQELLIGSVDETASERTMVLVPATGRNETAAVVITRRQRVSAAGLEESVELRNVTAGPVSAAVRLECGTDFADQFALRSDRQRFERSDAVRSASVDGDSLVMAYGRRRGDAEFAASVRVRASGTPDISRRPAARDSVGGTFAWSLDLAAGQTVRLDITAKVPNAPAEVVALDRVAAEPDPLRDRGLDDIAALRMTDATGQNTILAAGVPWFLALFGRDSLIASMLTEPDVPGLIDGTLRALAATQSTVTDARRVAQPGKIVHEVRVSELATLDEIPYGRYYGSVDSTPLFLSGLAASGSLSVQRELEPAARAAVEWMLGPGGLIELGFLHYTPDTSGLLHQGWKDSFDAIAHADGTIATGAIALCEVQGYAWRALVDTAGLAAGVWNDPEWAERLLSLAEALRERFLAEFWMPAHDFPALALEDGRRVEVVASNAGHLLFSGILPAGAAARVAERLLQPDMFTGWGLRTLSSRETLYHPLSYHNGSVWPHDTVLAALGMEAYGLRDEAARLASGIAAAAEHFDRRLPELFGGFSRSEFVLPVAYAHAARPQAWAAAAGVAAARILRSDR